MLKKGSRPLKKSACSRPTWLPFAIDDLKDAVPAYAIHLDFFAIATI
jgi:hypothetical protein